MRLPRFTDDEIDQEIEQLGLIERDHKSSWLHTSKRLIIRTARVLTGIALFFAAYLLGSYISEIGDIPFSALTLRQLFVGVGAGGLALLLVIGGWKAAFGTAPTEEEKHEARRQEALASLTAKHPVGLSIKTVDYAIDCTGYQVQEKQ